MYNLAVTKLYLQMIQIAAHIMSEWCQAVKPKIPSINKHQILLVTDISEINVLQAMIKSF